MRRLTLSLIIFALLSKTAIPADLSEADIGPHEEVAYRTLLKKTGEVIWQSNLSINKTSKDGNQIVKILERGRGRYNNSPVDMQ